MAKLRSSIGTIAARQMGGPGVRRTLALVLAVALTLTSAAPAWALKIEVEAEGEGSAPPGTLPGLEAGPELEGEETALSEEAPLPGEEGEEEVVVQAEPEAPEAEAPALEAPPVEAPPPEVSVTPEAATSTTPAPSAPPAYEAEAPPAYEPEEAAPVVVQGEAIVAPAAPRRPRQGGSPSAAATAPVVEAPPPAALPAEAPEPAPSPPATPPAEAAAAPGALQGYRFYTVRSGESLWSIGTALLPPGSDSAAIAAEVHRLWRLNAARIGTGDPNLLYVGTRLTLV